MPDRLIKESSCTSDTLNALSDYAERFWWRLTVNCDDYGRCDARVAVLKSKLFPLADSRSQQDMENALSELAAVGLITVYEVDGRPYLQIAKWEKHQRIRAKKSKFPGPEEGSCCQLTANDSKCCRNPIQSNTIQSESNPIQSKSRADKPPALAPTKQARKAFGEFGWVKLTDDEYNRLLNDLGEAEAKRCIAYVDESAQATGNKNKWRDWNLVLRKCHKQGWGLGYGNKKQTQAELGNKAPGGKSLTFLEA